MKSPKESAGSPAPNEAGRSGSVKPAKNRILVVDDDASVREVLTRVLVDEGYSVWAAVDGTAALEIAAATKIDLVLLDLNMPGKSGWDTFERLTAENPMLAVIIITARSNQLFTALGAGLERCWKSRSIFRSCFRPSAGCWRNRTDHDLRGWRAIPRTSIACPHCSKNRKKHT